MLSRLGLVVVSRLIVVDPCMFDILLPKNFPNLYLDLGSVHLVTVLLWVSMA